MTEQSPSSVKCVSHETVAKRKRDQRWFLYLIIAGLVLVNLVVLGNMEIIFKHAVSRLLFELQPVHWPWWYAVNLWLILVGLCGGFRTIWGKRLIALLFACTVFCGSEWLSVPRQWICGRLITLAIIPYKDFYVPFVYGPMVEYRTTGLFSWRLATLPILGIGIVIILLVVNQRIKNRQQLKTKRGGTP